MKLRNRSIQSKITRAILVISATVLLLTGLAYFTYQSLTFRETTTDRIAVLGEVISDNSTAALAFDSQEEAFEILSALRAEEHIVAAALYDEDSLLFSRYPEELDTGLLPEAPDRTGYFFEGAYLHGFQPVVQGSRRLGTLYLRYDLSVLSQQFSFFCLITIAVLTMSLLLAYLLSSRLQKQIARPIVALADVARSVSIHQDYSVRAVKQNEDEIGLLTDAFNQMLTQIGQQNLALQENESRIRAVMDSALSSVIVIDQSGNVTEWNSRAEDMFGWSAGEVLGKKLADIIIPPALRESHIKGIEHFLATGKRSILNKLIETKALRRDGTEFPVELLVNPLKTGDTTSFCGFITDITERKQAEQKLQSQLSKLDLLSHITRAIGERMDIQSIFQVVIQSLEDQLPIEFGCVGLHIPGNETLDVQNIGFKSHVLSNGSLNTDQFHIHIHKNNLSKFLNGQLIYESDIRGTGLPFLQKLEKAGLRSVVIIPLTLESSVFGALICARKTPGGFTGNDCEFLFQLSEHVALAAHQAQLHEALHQAYNDLRQTQQIVLQQERLRALGQMSSGIAHDINNAISPISLYTESLLETEPNISEKGRKYLKVIQQAIEDVTNTVARMREFYRKREPQLSLTSVNLNHLADQVIELTRAKWYNIPQQKGVVINIETAFHPDLPFIMGVESEIREALTNLVFNGVDAMPEGGTLRISTNISETDFDPKNIKPRKYVSLEVTDTGIGMDEETKRKCLEPFFTTKGERGTGLGLAMVYGVVQRHNADVEIRSSPGQGTMIGITFPIREEKTGEENLRGIIDNIPSRMRILIIDDDPLLLQSLRDTLEIDGHVITSVNGGQAGIDTFTAAKDSKEPFNVVITDLGMPYIDGRKVAGSVKKVSPSTPVIMLTGWGQRILEEGDKPSHVDHLMSKPPKLRDLREALSRLTQKE